MGFLRSGRPRFGDAGRRASPGMRLAAPLARTMAPFSSCYRSTAGLFQQFVGAHCDRLRWRSGKTSHEHPFGDNRRKSGEIIHSLKPGAVDRVAGGEANAECTATSFDELVSAGMRKELCSMSNYIQVGANASKTLSANL
jgi:hypothetical protein